MSVAYPIFLYAAVATAIGAPFALRALRRNALRNWQRWAVDGAPMPASVEQANRHRQSQLGWQAAALVLAFLAAADPLGRLRPRTGQTQGVNLAVVIDNSRSMDAEDAFPSRIDRAKTLASEILARIGGSRASILAASGSTVVMSPPTFDTLSARVVVQAVQTELASKGGSALGSALERTSQLFASLPKDEPKLVLLLSDGENFEGDPLLTALRSQRESGLVIHTITFGSGEPVTIPAYVRDAERRRARTGTLSDSSGQEVHTRSDTALMRELALAGHGRAWQASGTGTLAPLADEIVRDALLPAARPLGDGPSHPEPEHWYWVPTLLALGCFLRSRAPAHFEP